MARSIFSHSFSIGSRFMSSRIKPLLKVQPQGLEHLFLDVLDVDDTGPGFYALLDEQRNHLEPGALLAQRLVVRRRVETVGSVEHLREEMNVAHS
jgi:hypothetical protein